MFESTSIQAYKLTVITSHALGFKSISYVGILFIALIITHHFLFLGQNLGTPPFVKSWIPIFGSTFSFLWNPERFLLKCRERYGNIYTLYMMGKRLHVVCDPVVGIPSVFNREKTFSVQALIFSFGTRYLGRLEKTIDDRKYNETIRTLFASSLLAQDKVDTLTTEFNRHLQSILGHEIEKMQSSAKLGENGTAVEVDSMIQRIMFHCTGRTVFGETWPSDEEFFNDWKAWDSALYMMLKGYPSFFTRKAVSARERYYRRLLKMLKEPLINPSQLVLERLNVIPLSLL